MQILACFWDVEKSHPDVEGTWQGRAVAVTLYDGHGKPCMVQVAGIKFAVGPPVHPRFNIPPTALNRPVILSRDGRHAMALGEMKTGEWVEASGTLKYYGLKAPDSEVPVDDLAEPKRIGLDETDAGAVMFLHLKGGPRPAPATQGSRGFPVELTTRKEPA